MNLLPLVTVKVQNGRKVIIRMTPDEEIDSLFSVFDIISPENLREKIRKMLEDTWDQGANALYFQIMDSIDTSDVDWDNPYV